MRSTLRLLQPGQLLAAVSVLLVQTGAIRLPPASKATAAHHNNSAAKPGSHWNHSAAKVGRHWNHSAAKVGRHRNQRTAKPGSSRGVVADTVASGRNRSLVRSWKAAHGVSTAKVLPRGVFPLPNGVAEAPKANSSRVYAAKLSWASQQSTTSATVAPNVTAASNASDETAAFNATAAPHERATFNATAMSNATATRNSTSAEGSVRGNSTSAEGSARGNSTSAEGSLHENSTSAEGSARGNSSSSEGSARRHSTSAEGSVRENSTSAEGSVRGNSTSAEGSATGNSTSARGSVRGNFTSPEGNISAGGYDRPRRSLHNILKGAVDNDTIATPGNVIWAPQVSGNASSEVRGNSTFQASGNVSSVKPWGSQEVAEVTTTTTLAPGSRRPDGARVPTYEQGITDADRNRALRVMRENFPPVRDLLPIYWLHVPKAGSSFATTLAHYGCGNAIPYYTALREPHGDSRKFNLFAGQGRGDCTGANWTAVHCATTRWNTQCGQSSFMYFDSGHFPVAKEFPNEELHHVATMLREPTQRAISGYLHGRHDCEDAKNVQEYVECTKNCQTQLISGYLCGYDKEPTEEDYARATWRLDKFGFVGLTSHWDLSLCLFHAMHGGVCKPIEFFNVRPGVKHGDSYYNLTKYGLEERRRQPTMDEKLYYHAQSIFWRRIREYDVTLESCAQTTCNLGSVYFEAKASSTSAFKWDFASRPDTEMQRKAMHKDHLVTWPGRQAYDED